MPYLFEDYAFDPDRRELRRGADVVPVPPQVFDLLDYLIRHRERVVSKDELINAIWDGRSVSDAAVTTRLNVARTVIGDTGEEQRLIKTLPRKGFRFVGSVSEVQGLTNATADEPENQPKLALTHPHRPSVAVLPFDNLSSDPEQEFFAAGIAEDVLTTLSKIQALDVIARTSSFAFKEQSRDVREVGRLLGVRYVLEGSVRKAGDRVRLTTQLIDTRDGHHLWADHFDGSLDDVFDLQDRITQEIVAALEVRLTLGEQARVWRKRSGSPLAYEHFLKGRNFYLNFDKRTHVQARDCLERALQINPAFTPALYQLGLTLTDQARFDWVKEAAATYQSALDCASKALEADPGCGEAYLVIGYVRTFQHRHDEAVEAGEKAITLSPGGTDAYHMAGMYHGYAGNFREAIRYIEHAQRMSPLSLTESMVDEALARFHLGDFAAASNTASQVLKERPGWLTAQTTLIAAQWMLGQETEARIIAKDLLDRHPRFSVARWAVRLPYRRQEHIDALIKPLRLFGLPE
ncbi:winged helix-turn-helix domain-containing protein [Bradyrhizobium liaoningense]|uniref:winged helix-turn-helix domain-containing tetratricopeptide repeat protein n=1 Tax=Bradyrhizobium liaoningense TaxID=43992 RepID=UPI002012647C|nr:winged helix-turn-helix domain-containing protein [Bradyrhizobium liaoningense]